MLTALLMGILSQMKTPCGERVPELLFERVIELPAVHARGDELTMEKLQSMISAQAAKLCAAPAPVFLDWVKWERDSSPVDDKLPVYPKQQELDAWLQKGVNAVLLQLNDGKPDPDTLTGDALCERAMQAVAPALHAASEPVDDALRKVWRKKWPVTAVAKFLGDACKVEKLHATHRAELVCYARCRGPVFQLIERMEDCDGESEHALDEWLDKASDRLDVEIGKRR